MVAYTEVPNLTTLLLSQTKGRNCTKRLEIYD